MPYTLVLRDDVAGAVCVVPADDLPLTDGVLRCDAASAVRVAHAATALTWAPHPTLQVAGHAVAAAACDATLELVARVNGGGDVQDALTVTGRTDGPLVPAA